MGAKAPVAIPPEFLRREPAHALDEGTFNLTEIDCRIEGAAAVLQQFHAEDPGFAREGVDNYLRGRSPVRKVVERPARIIAKVPMNFRRAVITCSGKRNALFPR